MTPKLAGVFEVARNRDRHALSALLSEYPRLASAVDDRGTPLLHVAAELDDGVMVEIILDGGADLEAEAPWGQTAFEWAASMGSQRAAATLLARGAELSLWTAAALGMLDEVRGFLANGGPRAAGRTTGPGADLSGWPEGTAFRKGDAVSDAFYIACRNGVLDVARELHELGADVDAAGYFGATALHWAAHMGWRDVVDWLVEVGANARVRDPKFDATPAGWAREGGHDELARKLEALER